MAVRLAVCLAIAFLFAASALAAPSLTIDAPATYSPAVPFDVTVVLTGAEDLFLYNVELGVSSAEGTAGTDFLFVSSSVAAQPRYVFSGEATGGFTANLLGPDNVTITLSDFLVTNLNGVDTVAGQNDLVAAVTVNTSASQTGPLTFTIDGAGLELDTSDDVPIPNFDDLTQSLQPVEVAPEPSSLALMLAALAGVVRRRRRARERRHA